MSHSLKMSSFHSLKKFVNERLTAATEEILGVFEKVIVEYEEEIGRQRKLLDIVLKPEIKIHRTEISQSVCNNEVLIDQQVCHREKNSNLDQEDPAAPEIKEEQEETLVLKRENDPVMFKSSCGESDDSKDQALLLDPLKLTSIPVIVMKSESDREVLGVSEPNGDHLLSHSAKSQDCNRGNQEDARTDQKPGNTHFKCLFCAEEFNDFLKLKTHLRTHAGVKPFMCRVCGKEFNCQSSHITHMKTHTGEKPHTCINCGKSFSRGASLRRHNRTHTGEKPYSCVYCGKEFSYHSSLINHVRVHTGEKPYSCIWCGKRFTISSTLKIHTRVHTGEKPYKCNICGKNFAHNTGMRLHRKSHAQEKQQS